MPRLVRTEAVVEGRVEERWTLVEDDQTPEYESGDPAGPVGRPATRLTGASRASGAAIFTADVQLPGMLEARVLRSPHANARVVSIDVEAARAIAAVRGVLGPGEQPQLEGTPLLSDQPRYAGAAVAVVAADNAAAAELGLEALAPVYEPLGFVTDMDEAFSRQNVIGEPSESVRGDPDAALAAAPVKIEAEYLAPAQLHNSLETHCAVADWRGDELTVWVSTQAIYGARSDIASEMGIDPERVRVICQYMGGGFGAKFGAGPEAILAAALSRECRRPVRLVLSRREENQVTGFRTPARISFAIGADSDGTLQAIEASAIMGLGDDGWAFPVLEPAKSLYACPNLRAMVVPVRQNLGPAAAFRAPGVMEGTWALEQALDELAEKAGVDPIELRRRNHTEIDPGTDRKYTSKRLLEAYDRAAELAGWAERDRLQADGDGRVKRGMGVASQYWWGGGGPPAYAEVRIGKDARPVLTVGLQDLGTGTITACAITAAERLGVHVEDVTVLAGDTSRMGHGPFSGGSMTLASIAPAVRAAGHRVRVQLLELASDLFEISASDLVLADGEVRSVDGTLRAPLTDVTGKLGNAWVIASGSRSPNPAGMAVNTFGCQIAQVAVDTWTGVVRVEKIVAVHDVGRIVNPMGARSQVNGGILQGVGFALMEERVVDPTTGTVVNPGLEDYKIPTIADLPEIVCEFVGTPDPELAMGIKGLGEPPIIPTAGAIGNAIAHATGVRIREAPYTPRRVLEALAGVSETTYVRPVDLEQARELLNEPGSRAMGGGTDLLTQLDRGIQPAERVVDLRGLGHDRIDDGDGALHIGAAVRVADLARSEAVTARYSVLAEAASSVASPQLREMGTVGGDLCQQVRCWYFRHPDLTCWLRGGDTCYAQIGDHRKHGIEPGDCISVAPSDLAAALLALGATVTTDGRGPFPLEELYRRPTVDDRLNLALAPSEFVIEVTVPRAPDASAYVRVGERAAWSFALAGVAAARFGDDVRLAAIGVSNLPRLLDPADPLAGLPGLEMTGWKRTLLANLAKDAVERVTLT